jgi:hypothetical protein
MQIPPFSLTIQYNGMSPSSTVYTPINMKAYRHRDEHKKLVEQCEV